MKLKTLVLFLFLGLLLTACDKKGEFDKEDKWEEKECLYLLFPQTWIMPDDTEITLADEKDTAMKDWYEANPTSEEKPELVYPVDIKNREGDILTVNNEEEMVAVKEACKEEEEN